MSEQRAFDNREALDRELAEHIAQALRRDILTRGCASLAVSGGSTPKGMFARLAETELDWNKVWITLVDERWVAPDHADSNERLVRENLLQQAAADAHFISMKSEDTDAQDGLGTIAQRLEDLPMPISCVVLGMGGDGHTASWFPKAANLAELIDPANPHLLGTCDPITAPHQRITLTLPAVIESRELIIHITGDEKRQVLKEAVAKQYPIAAVLQQTENPATIWWAP